MRGNPIPTAAVSGQHAARTRGATLRAMLSALLSIALLSACGPGAADTPAPPPTPATISTAATGSADVPTVKPTAATPSPPTDAPTVKPTATTPVPPTDAPRSLATRTPAAPEQCPPPGDEPPPISPEAPGNTIIEIFEPQIRAYLDAGGSPEELEAILDGLTLSDGSTEWQARAQVLTADVTGNGTPEVVTDLSFFQPGQYADGALFVFTCQKGHYEGGTVQTIGGAVLSGEEPDPGIRAIEDMNRDGVPEIVFSFIEVIGTHANYTRVFHIVEWDGQGFAGLIQSETYPLDGATVYNGDGGVQDTDGDGRLELVLLNGIGQGYPDSGPQRQRTDVWAWDGTAFALARSEYEPPVYRFQAVQDGDEATRRGEYDRALAFYHQAISDESLLGWSRGHLWPDSAYGASPTPTPDPEERPRLAAYAHYRIMLLYAVEGDPNQAQVIYRGLGDGFPVGTPGSPYVELATAFWAAYDDREDLASACAGAAEYAASHADDILTPLSSGFYGLSQRDYTPEDICPFE